LILEESFQNFKKHFQKEKRGVLRFLCDIFFLNERLLCGKIRRISFFLTEMTISAKSVMELRQKTGVSMMACKKALTEANGDMDAAIDILRKSGEAKAAKKSDRETTEGAIGISGRSAVSVECETDFVARNENFSDLLKMLAETTEEKGATTAQEVFESEKAEQIARLGENLVFGKAVTLEGGDTVGSYIHSNKKLGAIVALNGGSEEVARDIAMHIVASNPEVLSPDEVSNDLLEKEKEIWVEQLKNQGKPEQIIEKILFGKERKFREESALLKQAFVKNPDQKVEEFAKDQGAEVIAFVRISV